VADQIQIRRDVAAAWADFNPILGIGEPGAEIAGTGEIGRFKIGDGVTPWNSLQYYGEGVGIIRSASFSYPVGVQGETIGSLAWYCPSALVITEIAIAAQAVQLNTVFDLMVNGVSMFAPAAPKPTIAEGVKFVSLPITPGFGCNKNDAITLNTLGGGASVVNFMLRYK